MNRMTSNHMKKIATYIILLLLSLIHKSSAFTLPSCRPNIIIKRTINNYNRLYATEEETSQPFFVKDVEETVNGSSIQSGSRGQSQEIIDDASDALSAVGWSAPMLEEELTSNDPFVQRINEQIQRESGVDLDELLNPAKVGILFIYFYLYVNK